MLSTCKIFLCLQEGKVCYTVDNEVSALARQTPGGRTPHMKGVGMLVVSLRGVNFGFWSHLGCSGQNAIIFSRDGSRLGLQAKKIYLLSVFHMVCFRGQKKAWATPRSIGLL